MSDEADTSSEKEHEPSQRRLEEARRQGDVARSNDLNTAAGYFGLLLGASVAAPFLRDAGTAAMVVIEEAPHWAMAGGGRIGPHLLGALPQIAVPMALLFVVPAIAVILTTLAQSGFAFAPSKLKPKLSRLSPVANAKQRLGVEGLVNFAKSVVKLMLAAFVLVAFLISHLDDLLIAPSLEPALALVLLMELLGRFLLIAGLVAVAIGGVDLVWQHHALRKRNRMTRKEMLDEMKNSDGDPQAKATRRQRGQDMAMNQMLADVPTASVVIVNPTHYAVALKWSRNDRSAPVVVAKGVDDIAAKIREAASLARVPIHSDPPTARAIFATCKIGATIDREHYKAVAAAIRFAERIRARAAGRGL